MAEERGGGSSVLMIVGTLLVTLTLVGGCGMFCIIGGMGAVAGLFVGGVPSPSAPVAVPSGGTPPTFTPSATPATPAVAPVGGARKSDIATLEPDRWHTVIDNPPTPLNRFDALKSYAWALGLAKAWRPDAELKLVFIDHVRPDGSMDLISDDEADADYRFYSRELTLLAEKAETVTDETIWSGFRVWVSEGEVKVMITDNTFTAPPMKKGVIDPSYEPFAGVDCDQAELIKRVRADASVDKRPFYEISVRWWNRRGWSLTTDPGDGYYSPNTCQKL